jgi:hypothetical protein
VLIAVLCDNFLCFLSFPCPRCQTKRTAREATTTNPTASTNADKNGMVVMMKLGPSQGVFLLALNDLKPRYLLLQHVCFCLGLLLSYGRKVRQVLWRSRDGSILVIPTISEPGELATPKRFQCHYQKSPFAN